MKNRTKRGTMNLFDHFLSINYIEYESNGYRNKTVSVNDYFDKIKPYLKDIINNLKKHDTWKGQLTTAINFITSKENAEEHVMHLVITQKS